MSDDTDKESKTQEASEKKTQDAVERGEKPVSRDVATAMTLFGAFFAVSAGWSASAGKVSDALVRLMALSGQHRLTQGQEAWALAAALAKVAFLALAPFVAAIVVAAIAAQIAQGDLRLSRHRIKFEAGRVSPLRGAGRLFGRRGVAEFLKAAAKLTLCGVVAALVLKAHGPTILDSLHREPAAFGATALNMGLKLVAAIAGVMVAVALLDFLHTRFAWRQSLRMTPQEAKEELKQADGDPLMKARMRSIALDRARRRMIADVERATVVIANPTHFAIALRYVREEGGAPLVLAKGVDLIALKIRARAEDLGIPVFESPPLARAMYDHVEVGRMIPPDFYRAVAEIINRLSSGGRA